MNNKRHIPSFHRVAHNLDTQSALESKIFDLEHKALSNPSSLTDQERRQILDFPDASTQQQNIIAASSLSKNDLLQRAATFPKDLSESELDLLAHRYWVGAGFCGCMAMSEEELGSLDRARAVAYRDWEKVAIENAKEEVLRRHLERHDKEMQDDSQKKFAQAHSWIHKLWDEEKGGESRRPWGYAVYWHPDIAHRKDQFENILSGILFRAWPELGMPMALEFRWTLHTMNWPRVANLRRSSSVQLDVIRALPADTSNGLSLHEGSKINGLFDGIQKNLFLYIDEDCVNSVLDGEPWVDDKWVWAVDPDYVPNCHGKDGYRGYLRVRLQQIIHRFFEARRFCADDYDMEYLWRASKKEFRNQVFVSVYDDEIGAWKGDRFFGSAIRKELWY